MPPQNLPWTVFGRPVKPVALVLMNTMLVMVGVAISDYGTFGDSPGADWLGGGAAVVALAFFFAWWSNSQRLAEAALLGAMFVWSIRVWVFFLTNGWTAFASESIWFSMLWVVLSGSSWLMERWDPTVHVEVRGDRWIRH